MREIYNSIKYQKENLKGFLDENVNYEIYNKHNQDILKVVNHGLGSFEESIKITILNEDNFIEEDFKEETIITLIFEDKKNIGYLNVKFFLEKEESLFRKNTGWVLNEQSGYLYNIEINNKNEIIKIEDFLISKEIGSFNDSIEELKLDKEKLKMFLNCLGKFTEEEKDLLKIKEDYTPEEDDKLLFNFFEHIDRIMRKINNSIKLNNKL